MIEVFRYQTADGEEPVTHWLQSLRDKQAQAKIRIGRHGLSIVILLCGGSKKTQATDIKTAKGYWADWKRRQA